jgi:OFA family oxalate/formate antiporter-like MFS transporter
MRYLVLFASILIQICIGGLYAWSEFVPALRQEYGLSTTQTQIIFGSLIAVFTVTMVFAGRLQDRRGPRLVAAIGGVLFACGYLLAACSGGSFVLLLLGIGLVAGAGTGFCYVCPLATCIKWFPRYKGLVTGVAVAGFGGGAVLMSGLAEILFAKGLGVLGIFQWIGLLYGAAILLGAAGLSVPPQTARTATRTPPLMAMVLRDRVFWSLAAGMLAGTFAGLLVIGNLKPIGLSGGVPSAFAALAISALAVGNAAGRIVWGWVSDRLGRRTIPLSLIFLGIAVIAILPGRQFSAAFVAISGLVGFGFGACFVIYAAQVAARYGGARLGSVYPLVFLSYGLSGLAGPAVGGWLFDATASYSPALLVGVAIIAAGAVASHLLLNIR